MKLEPRTCKCGQSFKVLETSPQLHCSLYCQENPLGGFYAKSKETKLKNLADRPPNHLTCQELAKQLNISAPSVQNWVKKKWIPFTDTGKTVFLDPSVVKTLILNHPNVCPSTKKKIENERS